MLSYVELTVVYPFSFYRRFLIYLFIFLFIFIYLFIYLFCLIMLTCYNLISSELPVKVA